MECVQKKSEEVSVWIVEKRDAFRVCVSRAKRQSTRLVCVCVCVSGRAVK